MKLDELELWLIMWGRAYGEPRPAEWDEIESPTGDSPTARGIEFAPKTRAEVLRRSTTAVRAGQGRRTLMAANAGVESMHMAPAWACEPVRVRETRQGSGVAPRHVFTPMVERVQTAWLALHGFQRLQAECLRVQYQVRAMSQREKAELVGTNVGDAIGLKRFKDELRLARTWMHARISA